MAQLVGGLMIPSLESQYPIGAVFCAGPTAVVEVTNPTTGKIWMDRNLGASQAATSSTDAAAYGDLYQWGRRSDGHQCRTSNTTTTLSSSDQPAHGDFITISMLDAPTDWRSPQNSNLWQGVNGINNPCPNNFRLPTSSELDSERLSWISSDASGALSSPLKFPLAGRRTTSGLVSLSGTAGGSIYWSSTVNGINSNYISFDEGSSNSGAQYRAFGFSVRCIKN